MVERVERVRRLAGELLVVLNQKNLLRARWKADQIEWQLLGVTQKLWEETNGSPFEVDE